jgi:hypothetical protein
MLLVADLIVVAKDRLMALGLPARTASAVHDVANCFVVPVFIGFLITRANRGI